MQNQFISLLKLGALGGASVSFTNSTLCWVLSSIAPNRIDPNCKREAALQHCTQQDMIHKSVFHPGNWLPDFFLLNSTAQESHQEFRSCKKKKTFVWLIIFLTFFFLLNKVNNTCYHSKLNCISCQAVFDFSKACYQCQKVSKLTLVPFLRYDPEGHLTNATFPTGEVSSFHSDLEKLTKVELDTSNRENVLMSTNLTATSTIYILKQGKTLSNFTWL